MSNFFSALNKSVSFFIHTYYIEQLLRLIAAKTKKAGQWQ